VTNQPGGMAPAGFYPAENGRLRYWDGGQWTSLYRESSGHGANPGANAGPIGTALLPSATSAGRQDDGTPASQAPFGPYWQPDGTPRYGDGTRWGQHVAAGAGAPSGPQDHRAGVGNPGTLAGAPTTTTLAKKRSWFARHKILTGLLGLFVLILLISRLGAGGASSATVPLSASTGSQTAAAPASPAPTSAPAAAADKAAADKAAADKAAADKAAADKAAADKAAADKAAADAAGTVSQQNAVKMAQDYLEYSAFSRSGLIDQLKFEGFSTADATYGVDKLNANWNEQAAKKAQDYLKYSSFSRSGLIAQLKFEGFTAQQAEYGVKQTGL
jgi:Host cell surface-exposed lipoprotein